MATEERDWRDIGKGGSRGWEESNYETLVREPEGDVMRLTRERDEARAIAREILTSRPAYDPIGWKQRPPWLDEAE